MGKQTVEENLEEIETSPANVFSVLTDLSLANAWGRTEKGYFEFPQESFLKLGQEIHVKPRGMKEPFTVKVRVIRHEQMIQLDIIDGPFFGNLEFQLEPRPYGTLVTANLNYRIERPGFNLKWKLTEKKKYHLFMKNVLSNIKKFSEMKAQG